MKVAIIDYGAGNTQSVKYALQNLNVSTILTANKQEISSADKVIFPGVGQASTAMDSLVSNELDRFIPSLKQPVLGICLGMQLLCNHSEEGNVKGLGVFDTAVIKFGEVLKNPQMGWNQISALKGDLFNEIKEEDYVYFVHSYYAKICSHTIAKTNYHVSFSAALQHRNFYGCQFHPEKSGDIGSSILKNFLEL